MHYGVFLSNVWEVKTVMSTQRRAAMSAGLLALVAAAPMAAQSGFQSQQVLQRGGPPTPETPYILVTTFHSTDKELGVKIAEELRKRISSEHSAKELFVLQKKPIDGTLEASGYRADSALSASDLMELAKQLRGEEVIDGTINKSATGVKVDAKMMVRSGQATLSQPLPSFDVKDVGEAAKQLERAISDANKARVDYNTCKNSALAAKYPEAAAAARKGIADYPASVFNRVCLLGVYTQTKAPTDSVIAVTTAILAADPSSMIARANLADAYMTKGDTTHAIEQQLAIYKIDPTNQALGQSIVQTLAQSGAPDKAIPIIDSLLVNNPGDPAMLRQKWLLQLRAGQLKQALASGEAYIKAAPDSATVDYFQRQIGAAQKDSNSAAVVELANRASAKYPKDPQFNLLIAQNQMKAGQLQQALESSRKASAADPKDSRGWLLAVAIQNQMKQPDSALATAQKAIAAGISKDTIGTYLLATVAPALKKAQDSKTREDWQAALQAAQTVDQIAPSPQSAFYLGVSAFSVAADALSNIQTLAKSTKKEDKAKGCEEVKVVEDNFAIAQTAMPRGGRVDAATAGNVMNGITQYGQYIPQFKKAFGCK